MELIQPNSAGRSSMREFTSAFVVFILLCASSLIGLYVQSRLRAEHRSADTRELLQLVIGTLVTFAALVLGLLTNSAAVTFDQASHDRGEYGMRLMDLDRCLRNYGPEAETARQQLRSYTAAVVASTWPAEPHPAGVTYPDTAKMARTGEDPVLARLMNRIGMEIYGLNAPDALRAHLLQGCLDTYFSVLRARAAVIEDTQRKMSIPFYWVLVFWLIVVFACFGLCSPRNGLALLVIILGAVSLSTALFVISELFRPYGGMFGISSTTMRAALAHMMQASESP